MPKNRPLSRIRPELYTVIRHLVGQGSSCHSERSEESLILWLCAGAPHADSACGAGAQPALSKNRLPSQIRPELYTVVRHLVGEGSGCHSERSELLCAKELVWWVPHTPILRVGPEPNAVLSF
jgi:hypothetical protein